MYHTFLPVHYVFSASDKRYFGNAISRWHRSGAGKASSGHWTLLLFALIFDCASHSYRNLPCSEFCLYFSASSFQYTVDNNVRSVFKICHHHHYGDAMFSTLIWCRASAGFFFFSVSCGDCTGIIYILYFIFYIYIYINIYNTYIGDSMINLRCSNVFFSLYTPWTVHISGELRKKWRVKKKWRVTKLWRHKWRVTAGHA